MEIRRLLHNHSITRATQRRQLERLERGLPDAMPLHCTPQHGWHRTLCVQNTAKRLLAFFIFHISMFFSAFSAFCASLILVASQNGRHGVGLRRPRRARFAPRQLLCRFLKQNVRVPTGNTNAQTRGRTSNIQVVRECRLTRW